LAKRIVNLPKDAVKLMKGTIRKDGTVKKEKEALSFLCDYLIANEEEAAVLDISSFVAERENISKDEIAKCAFELLNDEKSFSVAERKRILNESLKKCFDETDVLDFEGFITFRTEEYIKLLYSAVFSAAEKCLSEREYREMTAY